MVGMFVIGYFREYLIIIVSMFLHELGHVVIARSFGRKVYSFRVLPVGVNAVLKDTYMESIKNIVIYCGGPAANFIMSLSAVVVSSYCLSQPDDMLFFISSNICLAVFNLLPILPLDGGMILKEILAGRLGLLSAGRFVKRINRILSFMLVFAGIIQFFRNTWNFSLILIGLYTYFSFSLEEMEAALMNVKNIIYRRARLIKKGIYQARDLVVIKSVHLSEVLRHMDFDRFHIIYVLDEELNITHVLTEQEVIDGMLRYSTDITFEEYLRNEGK